MTTEATEHLTPDTRPLSLPAQAFDDSIELLDGVIETLTVVEEQLRHALSSGEPLTAEPQSLIRVCRAALRLVIGTMSEAEGYPGVEGEK